MNLKTALLQIKATLEGLDIKATQANMDRLLGCMFMINKLVSELEGKEGKADDGNGKGENIPG